MDASPYAKLKDVRVKTGQFFDLMFEKQSMKWQMAEKIALSDRSLPLQIRVNVRARRLTLRLDPAGCSVRVSVPPGTSEQQISEFLMRSRCWLEQHVARLPPPLGNVAMLREGVKIPYLGTPHLLVHGRGRGVTHLAQDATGQGQIILYGEVVHWPRHLRDFLQKRAAQTISPLVVQFAREVGRKPKSIRYKDTKSRWGSCTACGNLSFSWRIIMAPMMVVRYLVAHEVAHLVEMNHGAQFWVLCEKLCPETKRCRSWLKRNGPALHAIAFEP